MTGEGDVKRQTNADGAIPVCALCDSRLSGLIPLRDLINHAAGIEKADDSAQSGFDHIESLSGAEENEPRG